MSGIVRNDGCDDLELTEDLYRFENSSFLESDYLRFFKLS